MIKSLKSSLITDGNMNVYDCLIDSHCKPQSCVSINNLNTLWNHRSNSGHGLWNLKKVKGWMNFQCSVPVLQSFAFNIRTRWRRRRKKKLFSQYSQSFNKRSNVIHRCNNQDLLKGSSMQLLRIIGLRINRDRAGDPVSNIETGRVQPLRWQHQP